MTVVIEQKEVNGYSIAIEIHKFAKCFYVSAYPIIGEGMSGYPITSLPYSTMEKAKRRFNTLCNKAKRNEL